MPAILRIFTVQILASPTVSGSVGSYDQGAGLSAHELICNTMRCLTFWVGLYKIYNQYEKVPMA